MRGKVKNNYFTQPDRRPPKSADKGEIDDILSKAGDLPYTHLADIATAKIQMKTDSKHVIDYWKLNWFEAKEQDEEPEGFMYSVNGIPGYEPHLYYDLKGKRIAVVNTEYYGTMKSAGALGLSGVVLADRGGYPIHGSCVGFEKSPGEYECLVVIAPTGTGKTTIFYELAYNLPQARLHSDDYVFVFFKDKGPTALATENVLYVRTEIAENYPAFREIFKTLPIENVVESKSKCAQNVNPPGLCWEAVSKGERTCLFDEGTDRCYWSYGNSRVMLPRASFPSKQGGYMGKDRVINEAVVKHVVMLTRDDETSPIQKLDEDSAIKVLKEGRFTIRPGGGPPEKWGKIGHEPFYNPYPPEVDFGLMEGFFRKLHGTGASFHLLNTGHYNGKKITVKDTFGIVLDISGLP
jgi:hypothetical protein